jgi:hypothetical protein
MVAADLNAPSMCTPFRHTEFQPVGAETFPTQEIDGIECHHAIRAAAIRHEVSRDGQLAQLLLEVSQRHRDRARDVSCEVLLTRPDVDQCDVTGPHAAYELVVAKSLHRATFCQVLARHLLDFRQPRLC